MIYVIETRLTCEKFRSPRGFESTTSSIPGKCSTVSAIESCMSQKELTHIYISLSSTSPSSQTPSIIELNCLKGGLKWFVSGWMVKLMRVIYTFLYIYEMIITKITKKYLRLVLDGLCLKPFNLNEKK